MGECLRYWCQPWQQLFIAPAFDLSGLSGLAHRGFADRQKSEKIISTVEIVYAFMISWGATQGWCASKQAAAPGMPPGEGYGFGIGVSEGPQGKRFGHGGGILVSASAWSQRQRPGKPGRDMPSHMPEQPGNVKAGTVRKAPELPLAAIHVVRWVLAPNG